MVCSNQQRDPEESRGVSKTDEEKAAGCSLGHKEVGADPARRGREADPAR